MNKTQTIKTGSSNLLAKLGKCVKEVSGQIVVVANETDLVLFGTACIMASFNCDDRVVVGKKFLEKLNHNTNEDFLEAIGEACKAASKNNSDRKEVGKLVLSKLALFLPYGEYSSGLKLVPAQV